MELLLLVQGGYFAKKFEATFLKFSAHFFQNAVFTGGNVISSSFGYLFELILAS